MRRNTFFLLSLLTISIIGILAAVSIAPNFVHADTQAITSTWNSEIEISTGATDAERPSLATSSDGKTVVVVYNSIIGALKDIKYSYSTNFGVTWTKHQNVHPPSNVVSQHTDVTIGQNGITHVVWIEDSGLAYANSNNLTGFVNHEYFSNTNGDPGSFNPRVITYGSHVHIIWVRIINQGQFVYLNHVHSQNNGRDWGTVNTFITDDIRRENPDVAVDTNGNLHLAYQQQGLSGGVFDIAYLKGTFNGSTISWATQFTNITSKIVADGDSFLQPSIMYQNGRLEVSVTQNFVDPSNPSQAPQYIHHIQCNSACDDADNWNPKLVSTTTSINQPLYLDANPHNLSSSIIKAGTCSIIFFDGKITATQDDREQIFQTSSCNNWGAGRQDLTANNESREIKPSAGSNGWWTHVTFERFVNEAGESQIFVLTNQPAVYLPVIIKDK